MCATVFFWSVWATVLLTGSVPAWTRLQDYLPVPFQMPIEAWALSGAVVLTAGFFAMVAWRRRLPHPALMLWVGAVTLAWGLAMTLLLPWFDASKAYREVFTDAARHLPPDTRCIVLYHMGESERAMVDYYMNVPPRTAGVRENECGALLWRRSATTGHGRPVGPTWKSVWSGSRPAERAEQFELFVRARAQ
jgi:hypothetical protein